MNETPNLSLPYLLAAQAQKHVTHNEAIRALDSLVQLSVLDRNLASPPPSPAEGDRYIVDSSPSGEWAGKGGQIAAFQDGAWLFYPPKEGWIAWIADENALVAYDGSLWSGFAGGGGGGVSDHGALTGLADDDHPQYHNNARGDARYTPLNPATLGINATADATNRLAVASAASLFNHSGTGHQVKVNKNTPADTASFLFQTGFSGRAEMGTAGDDNFHFKVSADGAVWNEAIVIDRTSGAVTLPNTAGGGGGGGVTDHGALTGLTDDDHPQYHTNARGDARYAALAHGHDHGTLTGLTDDDHPQYHTNARGDARYTPINPATLGINVTADTAKRLAVSSPASLFTHAGNGHTLRVAKNATADTASLKFETGAAARAELGTTGDDDFHIKVSVDGTAWNEAIIIDKATGACAFPNTALGGGGGGGGAPTTADYLVRTANAGLSAERVVTDSTSIVADWGTSGQVVFQVRRYDELTEGLAYTSLLLADALNAAQFPSAASIADSFDALTYVDTAAAANLDSGTQGVLKPSTTTTTIGTTTGTSSENNFTLVDRSAALPNNAKVVTIGIYAATANASYVAKILKRNSAGNYDIVVSQAVSHPGGGWADFTLTTPHAIPASGEYYIGVYFPVATVIDKTASRLRSYAVGNVTGAGQTLIEDNAVCVPTRYSAINNLTVASAALPLTFSANPTAMSVMALVEETEAAVADTDFFVDASRNNGTTWVQAALSLVRTIPAGGVTLKLYKADGVDLAGHAFATACRYRLRTANAKVVKFHGVYARAS